MSGDEGRLLAARALRLRSGEAGRGLVFSFEDRDVGRDCVIGWGLTSTNPESLRLVLLPMLPLPLLPLREPNTNKY